MKEEKDCAEREHRTMSKTTLAQRLEHFKRNQREDGDSNAKLPHPLKGFVSQGIIMLHEDDLVWENKLEGRALSGQEIAELRAERDALAGVLRGFLSYFDPEGGISEVPLGPFDAAREALAMIDEAQPHAGRALSGQKIAELRAERDEARAMVVRLVAAQARVGWEAGESEEETLQCALDSLYNWAWTSRGD